MDGGGHQENNRHGMMHYEAPPLMLKWNGKSAYHINELNALHMHAKISMLCEERDAAIQERDRALAEAKVALDGRDLAIQDRDAAIADRDNALRERNNAIAALQFHETTMNALFSSGGGTRGPKHSKYIHGSREKYIADAFSISAFPSEATANKSDQATRTRVKKSTKTPKKLKKASEDINRFITKDGSMAEWDAREFGSIIPIHFDKSTIPAPVCSCTGVLRQCYRWGNGGWQSACCTTSLSVYPLPQIPNKKHARMGGRKMSGGVYSRLLNTLAIAGHDLSVAVDLKRYWAKHGTNRYITIK